MESNFLIEQFQKGGPVMWPLLVCSLFAIAFVLERIWILVIRVPKLREAETYLDEVEDILKNQGEEAAIQRVRRGKGVLNYVFAALLKRFDALVLEQREKEDMRRELMSAADEAGASYLGRFLEALSTIGTIVPLMGLLGTITGMIKAFSAIAVAGVGDPQVVAKGISEALITTATGLIIAIPTILCYRWLASRADRVLEEIELYTHTFGNTLLVNHWEGE